MQETAATLFRELGCSAEIEAKVPGVRTLGTPHHIDVWVTFDVFGQQAKWVIECKSWERPVTKATVAALKAIVDDVGADRGILISDSGFQPAAVRMASVSNIALTTRARLETGAKRALRQRRFEALDGMAGYLEEAFQSLYTSEGSFPGTVVMKLLEGVEPQQYMRAGANLVLLRIGLRQARRGVFPAPVGWEPSGSQGVMASDADEFFRLASALLRELDQWHESTVQAVIAAERVKHHPAAA